MWAASGTAAAVATVAAIDSATAVAVDSAAAIDSAAVVDSVATAVVASGTETSTAEGDTAIGAKDRRESLFC